MHAMRKKLVTRHERARKHNSACSAGVAFGRKPGITDGGHGQRIRASERVTDLDTAWPAVDVAVPRVRGLSPGVPTSRAVSDWQVRLKQRLRLHDYRLVLRRSSWWRSHRLPRRGYAPGRWPCLRHIRVSDLCLCASSPLEVCGAGRKLLQEAEAWPRERGATRIELDVFAENELGVGFWTHSGFRPLSLTMSKPWSARS